MHTLFSKYYEFLKNKKNKNLSIYTHSGSSEHLPRKDPLGGPEDPDGSVHLRGPHRQRVRPAAAQHLPGPHLHHPQLRQRVQAGAEGGRTQGHQDARGHQVSGFFV